MARPLQGQQYTPANFTTMCHTTAPLLLVLAAVAAIATVIVSLCTSSTHAKMWKQSKDGLRPSSPPHGAGADSSGRQKLLASLSGIGSKAVGVAKMVSWKRSASDDEEGASMAAVAAEEEALWKKTIMMGEKCRPLDFSGHIMYDSEGNQLPPAKAPAKNGGADKSMDHGIKG